MYQAYRLEARSRMGEGFSLIELLIVIAIIGVIAAVGVVGYNGYINSTRDRVNEGNMEGIARAIRQDNIALLEEISDTSDFSSGLSKTSYCIEQVETIVEQLNITEAGRNMFDDNCWKAFNGNRLWSHDFVTAGGDHGIGTLTSGAGCNFTRPTAGDSTVVVPRGSIMVACTNADAAIKDSAYKIYTCACVGQETCNTTDVVGHCSGSADPEECQRNFLRTNPEKCPSPGDDYLIP